MDKECKHESRPRTAREFFRSAWFWRPFIAITAGGLLGFVYFFFIGCNSGTCAITSNPYNSVIMGGIFGFLLAGSPSSSCNCSKQ